MISQLESGVWVADLSPHWICHFHKDPREYFPVHDGKWVYHARISRLERVANEMLSSYIVSGQIEMIKYKAENNPSYYKKRLTTRKNPPLCVYSTNDKKDDIKQILDEIPLKRIYWQSNDETMKLAEKKMIIEDMQILDILANRDMDT